MAGLKRACSQGVALNYFAIVDTDLQVISRTEKDQDLEQCNRKMERISLGIGRMIYLKNSENHRSTRIYTTKLFSTTTMLILQLTLLPVEIKAIRYTKGTG